MLTRSLRHHFRLFNRDLSRALRLLLTSAALTRLRSLLRALARLLDRRRVDRLASLPLLLGRLQQTDKVAELDAIHAARRPPEIRVYDSVGKR